MGKFAGEEKGEEKDLISIGHFFGAYMQKGYAANRVFNIKMPPSLRTNLPLSFLILHELLSVLLMNNL